MREIGAEIRVEGRLEERLKWKGIRVVIPVYFVCFIYFMVNFGQV